jgi:hypothetical protein
VYAITLSFLVGIFWIGGTVAGGLPGQSRSTTPTFTWVPKWGVALGDTTVNALLTYSTVTLVLYGISIGGQAAFTDSEHAAGFVGASVRSASSLRRQRSHSGRSQSRRPSLIRTVCRRWSW